jgi:phage terminase small subunit
MTESTTEKPTKAGRSSLAGAARNAAFSAAYLTNGHNATAAAIAAGCPAASARNAGWKMLRKPEVRLLIAARAEQLSEIAELNTANWATELRAVLHSNVGDLYGPDGAIIPLHLLPRHVQSAISGIKTTKDGIEYKFWDKCSAMQIVARHLGLFEKDNAQQSDITVRVELVG